jgi:tRNA(fMet)-specific endonuclease VapC
MLDTNAYTAFMHGEPAAVDRIARADEILLPMPVLAELRCGFAAGSREQENLALLDRFLDSARVSAHPVTERTVLHYVNAWRVLREAGTPIPANDLWIAACALETGSELLSADRHFLKVPGLIVLC